MLNSSIAQSIVDITMSVFACKRQYYGCERDGNRCRDKSRIGTFHCAAAEVIATGQKKAVSAQEAATMDNVEPGATYPIVYKGNVIGALGMTGTPEYVDKFVELGALYALLFIEQENMKQRVFQEQRVRKAFCWICLPAAAWRTRIFPAKACRPALPAGPAPQSHCCTAKRPGKPGGYDTLPADEGSAHRCIIRLPDLRRCIDRLLHPVPAGLAGACGP